MANRAEGNTLVFFEPYGIVGKMRKIGYIAPTEILQPNAIKERTGKREGQPRRRVKGRAKAQESLVEGAGHAFSREDGYLTKSRDTTTVVLLPVDPHLIHAYWVMSSDNLENAKLLLGKDQQRAEAILRFYDITYIVFNGSNAHNSFDVPIDLRAENWYVPLWSPEKSYCADLGLRTEDGRFFPLARSNVVGTPRACPSSRKEERYMLVEEDYKRIEQISPAAAEGLTACRQAIVTRGIEKRRVSTQRPEGGQASERDTIDGAGRSSLRRIEYYPLDKEALAEYGRLLFVTEPSPTRPFRSPLEGEPFVDLTEMSERGFVSGFSSALFHPLTGKIGG
jgi:hypothetical protein